LWGNVQVAIQFCIHPDVAEKIVLQFCIYYLEKVGPTRPWKKRHKKQKNIEKLKHCDDLNRALRVGGQKRNMQMKRGMGSTQNRRRHGIFQ